MRSMTGFGRATVELDGREITLELKAVNHRFLDLSFRMPRSLGFLEDSLRRLLTESLSRGHVDVYLAYRNSREDARMVELDEHLAAAYIDAYQKIAALMGVREAADVARIATMPDVLTLREKEDDPGEVLKVAQMAFEQAKEQLLQARKAEGERLYQDMLGRLQIIAESLGSIEESARTNAQAHHARLVERMQQLLGETALDPARIAQEAAIIADRAAIDEETVRLAGHIDAMREALKEDGPVGRRLDFLLQEMNREANTIGSKSTDLAITQRVLDIKGELEKIREQAQNIE